MLVMEVVRDWSASVDVCPYIVGVWMWGYRLLVCGCARLRCRCVYEVLGLDVCAEVRVIVADVYLKRG